MDKGEGKGMYGQNHSCEEGSKSVLIPENGPEEAVKKQDLGYVGDNNNCQTETKYGRESTVVHRAKAQSESSSSFKVHNKFKKSSLGRILKKGRNGQNSKPSSTNFSNSISKNGVKNCNRIFWIKNALAESNNAWDLGTSMGVTYGGDNKVIIKGEVGKRSGVGCKERFP